jgi:outer membrane lipoprotein-sorting protein
MKTNRIHFLEQLPDKVVVYPSYVLTSFNVSKIKIMKNYVLERLQIQKNLFLWAFLLLLTAPPSIQAQPTAKPAPPTDVKAKSALDKIKKQYDTYRSFEATFTLKMEFEKTKETQTGTVKQEGNKFRVEVKGKTGKLAQMAISDGVTVWFMPNANEVQITNASKKSANGIPSPKELIRLYDSGEFIYRVAQENLNDAGKNCLLVELVPKNGKKSEYSKVQIAVDTKTNEIAFIKVIMKGGYTYTMRLGAVKANPKFSNSTFSFNKSEFPNVKVSDLRVD